jgi:hypothetical protein
MSQFIRNYSLSLVLLALFAGSWMLHGATGWKAYLAEQHQHGSEAVFWGDDGFLWPFLEGPFENWQ